MKTFGRSTLSPGDICVVVCCSWSSLLWTLFWLWWLFPCLSCRGCRGWLLVLSVSAVAVVVVVVPLSLVSWLSCVVLSTWALAVAAGAGSLVLGRCCRVHYWFAVSRTFSLCVVIGSLARPLLLRSIDGRIKQVSYNCSFP